MWIEVRDEDGRVLIWNRAAAEISGHPSEQVVGHGDVDGWLYPDRARLDAARSRFAAARRSESPAGVKTTIRCRHGDDRVMVWHTATLPADASATGGLLILGLDVTAQERAEAALQQSEANYRLLVENQSDLVVKMDTANRFLFVSPSYCQVFGRNEADLLGQTLMPLVHEDDRAATAAAMEDLFRPPWRTYLEQRARTGAGWRWFGWADTAVLDDDGQVVAIIGVGRDITDRKLAEEALFEAKERAQVTLDSIGDAVITTDGRAIVEYLNPVAETLTGWSAADANGRPLQEVFRIVDERTRQPAPDPVERCLREGKVVGLANHSILLGRHGREHHIDDSAAPIRGRDGQVLGSVLVFHDVTENRQLARRMEYDATHDALTGLINRQEFERRLERVVNSARQYDARHALCYLDLDQFVKSGDSILNCPFHQRRQKVPRGACMRISGRRAALPAVDAAKNGPGRAAQPPQQAG